jgi:hypothetical protein
MAQLYVIRFGVASKGVEEKGGGIHGSPTTMHHRVRCKGVATAMALPTWTKATEVTTRLADWRT